MNLGKTFVQSLVREVGRGGGKVVSNKIYGSKHSTPIRVVQAIEDHTNATYSGSKKKYRHELDRILNGDLPGSKISVKKALVGLEEALKMVFDSNPTPEILLAWLEKTDKFVEKVKKIASDDSIEQLAIEVTDDVASYRGAVVEAIERLEMPDEPQKTNASLVLLICGIGSALSTMTISMWAVNDKDNNNIPDNYEFVVGLVFIVGVFLILQSSRLSTKFKKESNGYNNVKSTIESLQELARSLKN